jgi:hypothetical protein
MTMSKPARATVKPTAHGYPAVKKARAVPAMRTDALGRAKAKAPMGGSPADHVVAPPIAARTVDSKTMGKRLK